MQGQWLADVLQKLCVMKGYSYESVQDLPNRDGSVPQAPDERRLNMYISNFEKILINLPEKLPMPPKKITSTPPKIPKK